MAPRPQNYKRGRQGETRERHETTAHPVAAFPIAARRLAGRRQQIREPQNLPAKEILLCIFLGGAEWDVETIRTDLLSHCLQLTDRTGGFRRQQPAGQ